MATYSGNGFSGRTFFIGRQNGQVDKNGRPHFFEWLSNLPEGGNGRKFETRTSDGGNKYYEIFTALDGYLTGIEVEVKSFDSTRVNEKWLVIEMHDTDGAYKIEVGKIDGRYSTDLMKRLLDANFDVNEKLRLSPYATDNGTIGISCMSGMDCKLSAKRDDPHLRDMAQPITREWKGKTEYDWTPVAEWLFEQIQKRIIPKLNGTQFALETNIRPTDAASEIPTEQTDGRMAEAAALAERSGWVAESNLPKDTPFPSEEPATVQTDDLPF